MILRPKKRAAKDEEDSKEDVQGRKAAKGSCHCCGGMLKRNPDFAKVCGTCGARFHTYDCGNRRGDAGFRDFSECLRCFKMCACVDGPVVCHVTALRQSRQAKRSRAGSASLAGPASGLFDTEDPSSKSGSFDPDHASESETFDLGKEIPSLHAVAPHGSDCFDGSDDAFGCEEDDGFDGFDAVMMRVKPASSADDPAVRVAAAVSTNPATDGVTGQQGTFVRHHERLAADLRVENEVLRREVDVLQQQEENLWTQLRSARREAKSMIRENTLSDISDMVRKEREGGDRAKNLLPATVGDITNHAWTTVMAKAYKEQADWTGPVE